MPHIACEHGIHDAVLVDLSVDLRLLLKEQFRSTTTYFSVYSLGCSYFFHSPQVVVGCIRSYFFHGVLSDVFRLGLTDKEPKVLGKNLLSLGKYPLFS